MLKMVPSSASQCWSGALEKEKLNRRVFRNKEVNIQFNAALPIKQIVCTSTGEGGETLFNFRGV